MKRNEKNKRANPSLNPGSKPSPKPPKSHSFFNFGKQILVALVGLFLLVQAKKSVQSYDWVYNNLLKGNMETITKNPNRTVEERYQMRIGFPIVYMSHIKANTPDTAIILFPVCSVFQDTKEPNQDLSRMSLWCDGKAGYSRFLWPRKVVFESEKETSPFFERVTHVAIANGWGYDFLPYHVPDEYRINVGILPINQQQ
jgi:hypothetical protein